MNVYHVVHIVNTEDSTKERILVTLVWLTVHVKYLTFRF